MSPTHPIRTSTVLTTLVLCLAIAGSAQLPTDVMGADHGTVVDHSRLCEGRTPHPPIWITEHVLEGPWGVQHLDLGYTLGIDSVTGRPIYRPGSGVTSGTGTAEDPYVIEGWCILGTLPDYPLPLSFEGTLDGINIGFIEGNVIVRNNVVAGHLEDGIEVSNTGRVEIEGNIVMHNGMIGSASGIVVNRTPSALIQNNTVSHNADFGIRVRLSDGVVVEGNHISRHGHFQLYTLGNDLIIRDNEIRDGPAGIMHHGDRGLIARNRVVDNLDFPGTAIVVASGNGAIVRDNHIAGNGDIGIDARAESSNGRYENNTIVENGLHRGSAEMVLGGAGMVARNNTLRAKNLLALQVQRSATIAELYENEVSGDVEFWAGAYLRDNRFNASRVDASWAPEQVDARLNWWGCPTGPNTPGCSEAVGYVVYDPWITDAPTSD